MRARRGAETLSFDDAIAYEEDRLYGETEKMINDHEYNSFHHRKISYLSRGVYVDQLRNWMTFFPKEQFMIFKSEDFFKNPHAVVKRVSDFLELPNWNLTDYKISNSLSYTTMDATVRKRLIDYFEPHNQKLYEYLGVNFGWE